MDTGDKKKLLLFLSDLDCSVNIPVASTLAWLARAEGCLFDNYYDSYHQGVHFPCGDSRNLERGQLTGGTVCGGRHFEEFYFILHNYDVSVISTGMTIFMQNIRKFNVPVIALSRRTDILYQQVFSHFNRSLPPNIVMIGTHYKSELAGLEAYLYPEIFYRQAIGVCDSIPDEELAALHQEGGKILCVCVEERVTRALREKGYDVEIIDQLGEDDDYLSITERIALRWQRMVKGWILGDPTLVAHWIPTACEEDLISLYSTPQEKIVSRLSPLIASTGRVIYGRQYSDKDFFELSKMDQCLQVIDPCRPPFQSVRHVQYSWDVNDRGSGFYDDEYSDEELRQFARDRRILISLMFWSGMIREVENFYNIVDLVAMTGLRCGLVVTAQSYEYMMHAPFELLGVPVARGGVYPLIEPMLGSCGIGVGIEAFMTQRRLQEDLQEAMNRIYKKVGTGKYMPRGWWVTMDADLEVLPRRKQPKPVRFLPYPPYIQFRFHSQDERFNADRRTDGDGVMNSLRRKCVDRAKEMVRTVRLDRHFEPYRPYEFFRAGAVKENIIKAAEATGLQYMFTKAGFKVCPEVQYLADDFIALNYTSGQWDGWTPFETVNDVSDLEKTEKQLLKRRRPGWITSTVDSCLWTFSGEFWKKGNSLYEIADYCTRGGNSQKLINVRPYTISRYAKIIADLHL